ncbi:unnamed protein product [Ascophyllum nodosum]
MVSSPLLTFSCSTQAFPIFHRFSLLIAVGASNSSRILGASGCCCFTSRPTHSRTSVFGKVARISMPKKRSKEVKGKRKASELPANRRAGLSDGVSSSDVVDTPRWFKSERVRCLTEATRPRDGGDCVIYWMNRDKRAEDNWAMLFARHLAHQAGVPLVVAFVLGAWQVPSPKTTLRYAGFMLKGLAETEEALRSKGIPFRLLEAAEPRDVVPGLAKELSASAVVTDMSPLRDPRRCVQEVASELNKAGQNTPLFQVDAHNVVPVWTTSDHQETMARTIRPKIHSRPSFLGDCPELSENVVETELPKAPDWTKVQESLDLDRSVPEITWLKPGSKAGKANLQSFIDKRLHGFAHQSNDPNEDVISHMSPYLNMGQISAQAAVMPVKSTKRYPEGVKAFMEQCIVRRELSDNFCFYNEKYDDLSGAAHWARETLVVHSNDIREHTYSLEDLEKAKTHDDLWNAAQLQMVKDGKMHNFLRMYWAKKILEWSPEPAEALARCIFLNDKYELDGRDPNGFAGCAWSVMGVHDMGWKEREIFGKIRYMNYAGCMRKFDVQKFVSKYPEAAKAAVQAGGSPAPMKRKANDVKGKGNGKGKKLKKQA